MMEREYVDLGLSVKWATMNVGAESETETGTHFSWGDLTPMTDRKCCYCYNGALDDRGQLPDYVDAASYLWGEGWRMPTQDELAELADDSNCRWEWEEEKKAFKVTSLKKGFEGKYIFMPASGLRDFSGAHYNAYKYGYYWSSSQYDSYRAHYLLFGFDNNNTIKFMTVNSRMNGSTIRPVHE